MGFTSFGLSDHLMEGVRDAGHTTPTPIQSLAIGPALEGKDIIGCAQTGTGKTAAFILPLLHRLGTSNSGSGHHRLPRALVLTPTRELAQQVQTAAATYGRRLPLRSVAIYGGANMDSQTKVLRRGADVIIATPGRLIDHLERGNVNLSGIQVLVLDEADRMLDMGFIKDVRRIIGRVPPERQTLLFSATLSPDVTELAAGILHEPHTVEAGERRNPVETIVQRFFSAPREQKTELLLHLLQGSGMDSVLVFSRTKHGADKICRRLDRAGITAVAIHSNRTQSQRERALEGFRQGKFRVLVATDIAARGIDVSGISHVINYDVPQYAEDYIHRIGRTGRAGAEGEAITFVGHDEQQYVRRIEQYTGKRYSVHSCPGFTPRPQTSGQQLDPSPEAAARSRHVSHGKPAAGSRARHHQETGPARETQPKHPYRTKAGAQRKRSPFTTPPRKKAPPKRFDSFSSNLGGAGWSNY